MAEGKGEAKEVVLEAVVLEVEKAVLEKVAEVAAQWEAGREAAG